MASEMDMIPYLEIELNRAVATDQPVDHSLVAYNACKSLANAQRCYRGATLEEILYYGAIARGWLERTEPTVEPANQTAALQQLAISVGAEALNG